MRAHASRRMRASAPRLLRATGGRLRSSLTLRVTCSPLLTPSLADRNENAVLEHNKAVTHTQLAQLTHDLKALEARYGAAVTAGARLTRHPLMRFRPSLLPSVCRSHPHHRPAPHPSP